MEVVSEGSLQTVTRPASSEKRARGIRRLPVGGSFEQLPPEVTTPTSELDFDDGPEDGEDYDDDESGLLISQFEGDVDVEDFDAETTTGRSIGIEVVSDGARGQKRCDSAGDSSNESLAKSKDNEDASSTHDLDEMDPKIRKGLKKIRKLDRVLSEKMQKEKEVKTNRRLLEKMWREQNQQIERKREEEGHGKINLGLGHMLALGAPDEFMREESDEDMSVPFSPVFPTQPLVDDDLIKNTRRKSTKDGRVSSSDCQTDDQQSNTHKKNISSKAKQKKANFIKRNIALAADAGNVIPMTEEEKKRLEELLKEDTDQFVAEGTSVSDICISHGTGFVPDQESLDALSTIDQKLEALVPPDELDMLSEKGTWTPISEVELTSQATEEDRRSFADIDIGERVLREEKDMRDMKQRLLAIEQELQNLESRNEEDLDQKISREMLDKLISDSSRTTSRSTTISATVLSNLSTPRQWGHGVPLGEIEEGTDNYSSRTSSCTLAPPGSETPTNVLSLREYMDSLMDSDEDKGRSSSQN